MPKRRKTRPSGILTVLVIVGAAALLALVGTWVRGRQPRRVPVGIPQAAPMGQASEAAGDIQEDERRQLDEILQRGAK